MSYLINSTRPAAFGTLLAGALALAACGGGSAGGAAPSSPATQRGTGNADSAFRPAASGEIAAISGRTLQVQDASEQTAVTYSARTKFTAERSTDLAAVKVGMCVVGTSADRSGGTTPARSITADSVRIEPAANGSCTGPGRITPGGGSRPSGMPTSFPTSFARGGTFPSGAPSGALSRLGTAVAGKVTAVSGSTITVAMTSKGAAASSSSSASGTIHVTPSTTYTTTVSATHHALKVGLCAVVNGTTDSSGAVAASRIALTRKTNGSCGLMIGGGPNG
jgi:hypothetical protein